MSRSTFFTRCAPAGRAPKPLPVRNLVAVTLLFGALLCFGLGHLTLRFSLSDLRIETIRLQGVQDNLLSEINALRGQNEALKRPERLYEYARLELGMIPYRTAEREVFQMPMDVYQRYELARVSPGATLPGAPDSAAGALWLERLSERFGLISQALAGEKK